MEFGALLETDQGVFRARAIVAADGATGVGSRLLGRHGIKTWPAAQVEVASKATWFQGQLVCDFGMPAGGIAWVFPKSDHLSVGVCIDRQGLNPRTALSSFLDSQGLLKATIEEVRSHPIPVWNGRKVFSKGVILVAGDAAGLANPLTGAGIRRACLSGRIAAESLAAFFSGGAKDEQDLSVYDRRIHSELVSELVRTRLLAQLFYRSPGLFYHLGVVNARINPWIEQLLSGQKDYSIVLRELLSGKWLRPAASDSKRSSSALKI